MGTRQLAPPLSHLLPPSQCCGVSSPSLLGGGSGVDVVVVQLSVKHVVVRVHERVLARARSRGDRCAGQRGRRVEGQDTLG